MARWHFSAAMVTVIFAAYAATVLVTLLLAGRSSDQAGRRPVLAVALLCLRLVPETVLGRRRPAVRLAGLGIPERGRGQFIAAAVAAFAAFGLVAIGTITQAAVSRLGSRPVVLAGPAVANDWDLPGSLTGAFGTGAAGEDKSTAVFCRAVPFRDPDGCAVTWPCPTLNGSPMLPPVPASLAVPGPPAESAARGSEYALLTRQIRQAGLLAARPRYYAWKVTLTIAALAAGWALFFLVGDSWWQLAVAALLAVIFGQVGFLAHDAGHRQVFTAGRANYVLGVLCGNLAIGLSYGWWTSKHNRHHAQPNTEGADPDIAPGAVAFTAAGARAARGIQRLVFRYQAYLVIPMLFLEAAGLHASSVDSLRRAARSRAASPGNGRRWAWEAGLLALHLSAYLGAVFLVLSPLRAVLFILVQQGLFGFYLGCSFAPNHKGMPVLAAGDQTGFLRRQVLTSRNVRHGWLTDFALGGLNYQIEHHLFPSMPRPSLRRARPLVAAFCAERGLPYCEASLLGSYAQALRHLNRIGKLTRPDAPGNACHPVTAA